MLTKVYRGVVAYFILLWEYRYFWMSLVKAELLRRYRRSVLGLGWSMLQPLAMTFVLGIVYRKVFNLSFWDFAPMLLCGLAFWNMFSHAILRGCDSLVCSDSYIRQQPLPLAMFPLRSVMVVGFHFVISLLLTLAFVWLVKGTFVPLALLGLLPTLVIFFIFSWSMAVLAGYSHAYFPDTQHLAEVGLQVVLFLTPIMYPSTLLEKNGLHLLLQLNPLAVMLEMLRCSVLHGEVPALSSYALACCFTSIPVLGAMWATARLEHRLIFAL